MKYCDHCGAKNLSEARFCTSCGAQLPAASPTAAAVTTKLRPNLPPVSKATSPSPPALSDSNQSPAAPPPKAEGFSRRDILQIARLQKQLIWLVPFYFLTCGLAGVLAYFVIYRLATALGSRVPWLWVFIPFNVLILNNRATHALRQGGIEVSLMGARKDDFERLVQEVEPEKALAAAWTGLRCVACSEPIEAGVTLCPECGWTQPGRAPAVAPPREEAAPAAIEAAAVPIPPEQSGRGWASRRLLVVLLIAAATVGVVVVAAVATHYGHSSRAEKVVIGQPSNVSRAAEASTRSPGTGPTLRPSTSSSTGYRPCSPSLTLSIEGMNCWFRSGEIDSGTFKRLLLSDREIEVPDKTIEKGGFIQTRDFGKIKVKAASLTGGVEFYMTSEQEQRLTERARIAASQPPEAARASADTSSNSVGFRTYSNAEQGLQIKYPETWTQPAKSPPNTVAEFIPPTQTGQGTFLSRVAITSTDLSPRPMTLDEYAQASLNQMGTVFTNVDACANRPATLSGYPARLLLLRTRGRQPITVVVYAFVRGITGYHIMYMGLADHHEKDLALFHLMATSTKITP